MPKKLVLSSIALHAAALAATIIAAIMYLARDFADTSISDLLDTYQIFLFGLVIGSVLYLADIVMLAKANNRDVISDAQTSALYASVVGDLCMAFCVFPLFINHPALALGTAAECLIVGNFALRMVCTVKLSHAVQEQPSEKKHSSPAFAQTVTLSPKEKRLSLAAAFTGLACIVLGIALLCVIVRIRILSNVQSTDADIQTDWGIFFLLSILITISIISSPVFFLFLSILFVLFRMATKGQYLDILGITITLWIMNALTILFFSFIIFHLPPDPVAIVTAVLLFSAETAQAILCTVLQAYAKRHSPVFIALPDPDLIQSDEASEESVKAPSEVNSDPFTNEWSKPPYWRL
ncbi:MAG TPA: hypothetical protein H9670_05690 [Firmicutes bacterium]|nr:hypothetical protein [Bacillota bacterium]